MKPTAAEPRTAAFEILRQTSRGVTLGRALPSAVQALSPRDRRLAHQIAAGVLRERRRLDRAITEALTRPETRVPGRMRDILRIGVYQLQFLDKVPSYAAVSTTVSLARSVVGDRAAGLANAVLRSVNRSRVERDVDAMPLAERFSHPDWLVERWLETYSTDDVTRLLKHNNVPPLTVVQEAGWSQAQLRTAFGEQGVPFTEVPSGPGLAVKDVPVESLPGYDLGGFIVQDSGQRQLLRYAKIGPDDLVWDACAAPGGKALTMGRTNRVIATDRSTRRLARLIENRNRVMPNLPLGLVDARHPAFRAGAFDAVVVDAPCSATGVMARHPDARWSLSAERIATLAEAQTAILEAVHHAVRPGGLLVYMTCSIEPEENQNRIDWFIHAHPAFERTEHDLLLFPPDAGSDGGFGARMRKKR